MSISLLCNNSTACVVCDEGRQWRRRTMAYGPEDWLRPEDWLIWRQRRKRITMTTKTMKYPHNPSLLSSSSSSSSSNNTIGLVVVVVGSAFPSWCYASLRRPFLVCPSRVDTSLRLGRIILGNTTTRRMRTWVVVGIAGWGRCWWRSYFIDTR